MERWYALAERFAREMVAIPTVNGNEEALAQYIQSQLQPHGFRTELQPIAPGRSNLCACLGSAQNRLIFTGHLDVVPPGDGWQQGDPFRVREEQGRLYGRGTCDMKGGMAAMMAAAIRAAETGELGQAELRLVFVVDEEQDGLGSRHYAAHEAATEDTVVVIGEPTGLQAHIAHRGVTRYRVRIHGRQCHSGLPWEGVNALYGAARFALEIEKLDESWKAVPSGILPSPNITATVMTAGVKENAVPGLAELLLDIRTVPGQTPDNLRPQLEAILDRLFAGTQMSWELEQTISVSPSATQPDGRAATLVKKAGLEAFGRETPVSYFTGCCDMPYFCERGYAQTLLCGPGSMDQAHTVDEYLETDQLYRAVDLYCAMVRQMGNEN